MFITGMNSDPNGREAVEADRSLPKNDAADTGSEPQQEPPTPEIRPEDAMLYCPVCSTRLQESRCKLVCKRCGYYMSCADYY